ncbi:MAG: hypothetical protein H6739_12090 [Alphaproteobacteria bacterium]|nr:hypothetical protein [Alphaproteobacteria bacterium]
MTLPLLLALALGSALANDEPWSTPPADDEADPSDAWDAVPAAPAAPAPWTPPPTRAPVPGSPWTPPASASPPALEVWTPPPVSSRPPPAWTPPPMDASPAWTPPQSATPALEPWTPPDPISGTGTPPVPPSDTWGSTEPAASTPSDTWGSTAPVAPAPPPPPAVAPALSAPILARQGRSCVSDFCARGDRLSVGSLRFDGVSAIADLHLGFNRNLGTARLGLPNAVPVAGVAATWTSSAGRLDLPFSPMLLVAPVQSWRDYEGNLIRTHGGALALNLAGMVSVGWGFGHHNRLPVNFYDRDGDGEIDRDMDELQLGTSRLTSYTFVMFTPVTFVRQLGPQLRDRG